jgi:RecA-family ATPase
MRARARAYSEEAIHEAEDEEQYRAPRVLPFIDMGTWDDSPAPQRLWGVRDRIPLRQPTLFSGEGAIGKSLVELHLCVAHVLGRDWLGSLPEIGPAIYFGAEDEQDELHRRLVPIADHYHATFADLISGGLHLVSLAGQDALLAVPDRHGKMLPTSLFNQLLERACDIKPVHVGIDTSADVFGGNENDRTQVRQFVGLLRKLAIAANTSVVLMGHPSLTGINSGTGLSGSTGWHNSVRARMYLASPASEEGGQPDSDLRELRFKKNNYGPVSDSIVLRYQNGLFLPERSVSGLDKIAREAKAEETFLDLLKRFADEGRNLSHNANSRTYAPTVFGTETEAKKHHLRKADLEAAMRRLFEAKKIHVEHYGRPSRPYSRIAIKD